MITYSMLGKNGQLGNQMFQYAALYGTTFIKGVELGVPSETTLSSIFELPSANFLQDKDLQDKNRSVFRENSFSFSGDLWCIPDDVDILGYFQSENYFLHCSDRIREEFKFKSDVIERANNFLDSRNLKFNDAQLNFSIHVRRGDYLQKSDYHHNLSLQYYRNISNGLIRSVQPGQEYSVYVFSDDIEWCKENLGIEEAFYVDSNDAGIDLQLMSRCNVHVIANSSFSWWGAWLSNAQREHVFAPQSWFGPQGPQDNSTLYANGWRIIGGE